MENTHLFLYDYNAHGEIPDQLGKALTIARSQQDHYHIASFLAGLAYINIRHNHRNTAAIQLNEANQIAEQQNDINALTKIRKIHGALLKGEAEQAQAMWDNALNLAIQANNPSEIVTLHYNLANLHWEQARLDDALNHVQDAQPFLPRVNIRLQSFIYSVQGSLEWLQGKLSAAESSYEQALALARPLNNPANLTVVFLRYGYLSRLQKRYDKAQIFFEQGIHNAKLANRTADHIKLLSRYAEIMTIQKQYEEAYQTLQKGEAHSATINNPICTAYLQLERGRLELYRSSKPYVARPYLEASLVIAHQLNNVELLLDTQLCLGEMYVMDDDIKSATRAFERVAQIADDSGFVFYKQLAEKHL